MPIPRDKYFYDRLIRIFIKAGFGTYKECAEMNLVDAIIQLQLEDDVSANISRWLNS